MTPVPDRTARARVIANYLRTRYGSLPKVQFAADLYVGPTGSESFAIRVTWTDLGDPPLLVTGLMWHGTEAQVNAVVDILNERR